MPSTLKVTNLGDGGKGTLRYEIAQAQNNDTIVFDKRLDGGTITLYTDEQMVINKNLTIQGPGAGLLTITSLFDTTQTARIFEVLRGTAVAISGLTMSHGSGLAHARGYPSDYWDGYGGGILNFGTLTISGCTLSNNSSCSLDSQLMGGGIHNAGTLTVTGCTLSNNSTMYGYGGAIYNAGTLTVSGGSLSNNSTFAGYGGGIYNAGTATVSGCTLSGNSADSGGGIANFGALTVGGCQVSGNTASPATGTNDGSAIANGGGGILNMRTLTVSNSTFSGNTPDNIAGPFTDGGGNTFR